MVVCRYFQQGTCRFGDRCRFEHPGGSSGYNSNSNNAYKWYGGDKGDSNRGVTFRDSFSSHNRFEPLSQQNNRSHGNKAAGGLSTLSTKEVLGTIATDVNIWEKCNLWSFSCYSYFRDGSCIPGFDDFSPEEMRLEAYEALKSGNFQAYIQKVKDKLNSFRQIKSEYSQPSSSLKQKLVQLIEDDRKRLESGLPPSTNSNLSEGLFSNSQSSGGLFGNSQTTTGLFGKGNTKSGGLFGDNQSAATNSIFGGSQTKETSGGGLFGQSTGSIFGGNQPTAASQSGAGLFGQSGTSAFGNSQQNSGQAFGNTQSSAVGFGSSAGGFGQSGNTPFGQVGGASAFQTNQPNSSTGLFGKPASSGGSLFGSNGGAQTSSGLFGSNSALQTNSGSLFGSNAAPQTSGSLFGSNAAPQTNSGSLFGSNAAPQTNSGSLFGSNAAPQTSGSLFGSNSAPQTNSGSLFGSNAAPQTNSGSLFGSSAAPQTNSGSLFGSNSQAVNSPVQSNPTVTNQPDSNKTSGPQLTPKTSTYTPLSDLTVQEKNQFEATHFSEGNLPTRPPPKELCF